VFGGGFGVAGASLWGRVRRVRRWRWRLAQLLIALLSLPLLTYDMGARGPIASDQDKFWHDGALPFLVLAAFLPVWRAPEEGLPDALRLRELNRRLCRRAAVLMLLEASAAVGFDHWYAWHGSLGAASTASEIGACLFGLSPLVWLLDPVLWVLWPAPIRRAVRSAQAAEALYRPKPRRSPGGRRLAATPVSGSITDFDADQGAVGRPRAVLRKAAGTRSSSKCTAPSRARQRHNGPYLHWDGADLVAGDARGRTRTVRLADADHPDGVAELVWLSLPGQLLFLDRDGCRIGPALTGLRAQPGNLGQVAAAAGLAFNAYELSYWGEIRAEQSRLLFPRRSVLARRLRNRVGGR
jgi:hypothetical protein